MEAQIHRDGSAHIVASKDDVSIIRFALTELWFRERINWPTTSHRAALIRNYLVDVS